MGCNASKIEEVYSKISSFDKYQDIVDIDINAIYENNNTILSHAVQKADIDYDIIIFILECGAKINQKIESFRYGSVLHYATKNNLEELTLLLLEYEANVNMRDDNSMTPLMFAARYGYPNTAELLLNNGANINYRHKYYGTPLMTAIEYDNFEVADLILTFGPNCNLGNNWTNPLIVAVQKRSLHLVKKILSTGAEYDVADSYGVVPLLHAIKKVYSPIVKELLRYEHSNLSIELAISVAEKFNHKLILKLLEDYQNRLTIDASM